MNLFSIFLTVFFSNIFLYQFDLWPFRYPFLLFVILMIIIDKLYFNLKRFRTELYLIFIMLIVHSTFINSNELKVGNSYKVYGFLSKGRLEVIKVDNRTIKMRCSIILPRFSKTKPGYYSFRLQIKKQLKSKADYKTYIGKVLIIKRFWLNNVRDFIRELIFKATYEHDIALYGFIKAILLGEKECLKKPILLAFKETGIMHILAISGLHLNLISGCLFYLCFAMGLSEIMSYVLVLLLLSGYLLMLGYVPSIFRAYLMITAQIFGKLMNEEVDSRKSLLVAFTLMVMFRPNMFYSASFQLSFLATAGIVFISAYFKKLNKNLFFSSLVLNLAIALLTFPIQLHYFGMLKPTTILLNMIFVPIFSIFIMASFLLIPIFVLNSDLGYLIGWLLNSLFIKILSLMDYINSFSLFSYVINIKANFIIVSYILFFLALIHYYLESYKR